MLVSEIEYCLSVRAAEKRTLVRSGFWKGIARSAPATGGGAASI